MAKNRGPRTLTHTGRHQDGEAGHCKCSPMCHLSHPPPMGQLRGSSCPTVHMPRPPPIHPGPGGRTHARVRLPDHQRQPPRRYAVRTLPAATPRRPDGVPPPRARSREERAPRPRWRPRGGPRRWTAGQARAGAANTVFLRPRKTKRLRGGCGAARVGGARKIRGGDPTGRPVPSGESVDAPMPRRCSTRGRAGLSLRRAAAPTPYTRRDRCAPSRPPRRRRCAGRSHTECPRPVVRRPREIPSPPRHAHASCCLRLLPPSPLMFYLRLPPRLPRLSPCRPVAHFWCFPPPSTSSRTVNIPRPPPYP
mmetsp:Transcript_19222/g.29467  ORF Transcript_19222/g.29467 Transcript_19222/m.29467 type:complete len:307 (-) Transcript_19222:337-1257(-)